jgi:hypothetical protein
VDLKAQNGYENVRSVLLGTLLSNRMTRNFQNSRKKTPETRKRHLRSWIQKNKSPEMSYPAMN